MRHVGEHEPWPAPRSSAPLQLQAGGASGAVQDETPSGLAQATPGGCSEAVSAQLGSRAEGSTGLIPTKPCSQQCSTLPAHTLPFPVVNAGFGVGGEIQASLRDGSDNCHSCPQPHRDAVPCTFCFPAARQEKHRSSLFRTAGRVCSCIAGENNNHERKAAQPRSGILPCSFPEPKKNEQPHTTHYANS